MKPWVRNILRGLCAPLEIAGAAYCWFIVESHVTGGAEYALDIGEARRLASDGWEPSDLPVYSYRVV